MSKRIKVCKFWVRITTYEELRQERKEYERLFREEIEEYEREKANGKISEHFSETDENDRESPSQEQFSEEDDRKFEQELPEWRDKENKLIEELESMDKNKGNK